MFHLVGSAPKILADLSDVTCSAPASADLVCSIDLGDPVASVKWFRNDKPISGGKKYAMTVEDDSAVTLTCKETQFSDGATYRVEASNKLGRVQSQCTLTVNCKYTT